LAHEVEETGSFIAYTVKDSRKTEKTLGLLILDLHWTNSVWGVAASIGRNVQ